MDSEKREAAEHAKAEDKLDKAEGAIRKALDEIKGLSEHLRERTAGEKERRGFPVDDDPPGDMDDASHSRKER